ncbi:MAG: hypothetical protein NPIRA05_08370 [Nitrospirales bacterium]|nr:MAG: hypothetical protein NPIRA05_08370 [Nitrospirales bacterium]
MYLPESLCEAMDSCGVGRIGEGEGSGHAMTSHGGVGTNGSSILARAHPEKTTYKRLAMAQKDRWFLMLLDIMTSF